MSTLKTANIANLSGTSTSVENVLNGTAKAWVNFNGTGTVAIRESYNVSSITDNGTGDYTINFTKAMLDANYSAVVGGKDGSGGCFIVGKLGGLWTTTQFQLVSRTASTLYDSDYVSASFFR